MNTPIKVTAALIAGLVAGMLGSWQGILFMTGIVVTVMIAPRLRVFRRRTGDPAKRAAVSKAASGA